MADLTASEAAKLDKLRGKARNLTLGTRLRNLEIMTDPAAASQIKIVASEAIAAGELVSFTSWDSTNSCFAANLADANNNRPAHAVALAAISNAAVGYVSRTGYIASVDTSLATLGDAAYLSDTAGGWSLTESTTMPQVIGTVAVVNATTGRIAVCLGQEVPDHTHASVAGMGGLLTVTGITDLDCGASGTAGTLDIFPTTALKGKIALTAADSAGNTTTTIVNASQAAARTYTIPDAGAAASFVMTAGSQTLTSKTLTAPTITGGTAIELTGLSVRSTGAAFDLLFASSEVLSADRTLSFNVADAAKSITLTGNLTVPMTGNAVIAESTQRFIPVSLLNARELATNQIGNGAANGGLLASDTTPIIQTASAGSDHMIRINWAATNVDPIAAVVALPPDLDEAANLVFHFRATTGGATDNFVLNMDSWFNEGDTTVADTSAANISKNGTYAEGTVTVAAADVPAGAQTMAINLYPAAHANDTFLLNAACWLEYTGVALTT